MKRVPVVSLLAVMVLASLPGATDPAACTVLVDPALDTYDISSLMGGPALWDDFGIDLREVRVSPTDTDLVIAFALEPSTATPGTSLYSRDYVLSWRMQDDRLLQVFATAGPSGGHTSFYDGDEKTELAGSVTEDGTQATMWIPYELLPGVYEGGAMREFHVLAATGVSASDLMLNHRLPTGRYDVAPAGPNNFSEYSTSGVCESGSQL